MAEQELIGDRELEMQIECNVYEQLSDEEIAEIMNSGRDRQGILIALSKTIAQYPILLHDEQWSTELHGFRERLDLEHISGIRVQEPERTLIYGFFLIALSKISIKLSVLSAVYTFLINIFLSKWYAS